MQTACDRIIQWGLACLIAFTPIAFGTVELWSIALMEWGVFTLVLVFALSRLWPGDQSVRPGRRMTGPALGVLAATIGLFLLVVLLQTVPLPSSLLKAVSPGSARTYASVDAGTWDRAEAGATEARAGRQDPLVLLDPPVNRPVSVNPARTRDKLIHLVALIALFFLVSAWADDRRVVSTLKIVTVVGSLIAVFGLFQLLTWNGMIYWVRKVPTVSATIPSAFGPFVNHNHFAGYVEMIIPVALSLAFWLVDRRRVASRPGSPGPRGEGWGLALREGAPGQRSQVSQGMLAMFAAVILIVSLFFSISRGGILSACISGAILLFLLCRRIASRPVRVAVAVVLPAVVVLLVVLIGAETVKKQLKTYARMPEETSFTLRAVIWDRLLQEFPAYAWVGAGLGTFEDSFAPMTPAGSARRWDKAHNDYLHLLWETGLVGSLLFVFGVAWFVRTYWWPALRAWERPEHLFGVGMAISLLSIALHSLVDFSLQIGANGFLCALLAGLIVALRHADEPTPAASAIVRAVHPGGAE